MVTYWDGSRMTGLDAAGLSSKSNTFTDGTPVASTDLMANALLPENMKSAALPKPIVVPLTSSMVDTQRTPSICGPAGCCCGMGI